MNARIDGMDAPICGTPRSRTTEKPWWLSRALIASGVKAERKGSPRRLTNKPTSRMTRGDRASAVAEDR